MIAAHLSNTGTDTTLTWTLDLALSVLARMDDVGPIVMPLYQKDKSVRATKSNAAAIAMMIGATP